MLPLTIWGLWKAALTHRVSWETSDMSHGQMGVKGTAPLTFSDSFFLQGPLSKVEIIPTTQGSCLPLVEWD